jgi:hypothetical protein
VVEPIWLVPPPGLGLQATPPVPAAPAGDPSGRLDALVEAGAVAAHLWALRGPEAARGAWGDHARLGLAVLDERLRRPGRDTDRFSLAVQVSTCWPASSPPAAGQARRPWTGPTWCCSATPPACTRSPTPAPGSGSA